MAQLGDLYRRHAGLLVGVLLALGLVGAVVFLFVDQTVGAVILGVTGLGMLPFLDGTDPPDGGQGATWNDVGTPGADIGSGPFFGGN